MKAAAVRRAAERYGAEELAEGIRSVTEDEREVLEIEGDDMGERLTHLLLALRVRVRVDGGEALKDAFRGEMAAVRETLVND